MDTATVYFSTILSLTITFDRTWCSCYWLLVHSQSSAQPTNKEPVLIVEQAYRVQA